MGYTKNKKAAQAKAGGGWNQHVGKWMGRYANHVLRREGKIPLTTLLPSDHVEDERISVLDVPPAPAARSQENEEVL